MVRWLVHPNELNAVPAKIEVSRRVTVNQDQKTGTIFFFRFRTEPPHWAAKTGWMIGVDGPYWDGQEPREIGEWTFSNFTSLHDMKEEEQINRLLKSGGFIPTN